MRKIEHIGIAEKNLETSNLLFEKLFGQHPYKEEEVASEGVKTSFFMNGPNKIEPFLWSLFLKLTNRVRLILLSIYTTHKCSLSNNKNS